MPLSSEVLQVSRESKPVIQLRLSMWNKSGLALKDRKKFRTLLVSARSCAVGLYVEILLKPDPVHLHSVLNPVLLSLIL